MDPEAPVGADRRGVHRWRTVIVAVLAVPALLFLVSNLVLSSGWSCRWIAGKIQRKIGLATHVTGASWSPWNGASLHGLTVSQPEPLRALVKEPLLRIDTVRVAPVWRAWLRGRLEIRSINLDSPRFVVPLEIISHLATPPSSPPQPQLTQASTPQPPTVAAPVAPPVSPPPTVAVQPSPAPEIADLPPQPPQPTGWLQLKDASFAIVHAGSHRTLLEISKTTAAIPISGDPARSQLHFGKISSLGSEIASGLIPTLSWKSPVLSLDPYEIESHGHKLTVAAKIARFSQFPVQIEAQFPAQPLTEISLPFHAVASAKSFAANARFRGLLLAPITWQGEFTCAAESPALQVAENSTIFDRGSAVAVLRGGAIVCPDARLIGDALSVLGNATLLSDGRVAAALRWVAPPETAASIASRVFPILQGPPSLTELSTPQRAAFDIDVLGTIGELLVRLGKEGPVLNIKP